MPAAGSITRITRITPQEGKTMTATPTTPTAPSPTTWWERCAWYLVPHPLTLHARPEVLRRRAARRRPPDEHVGALRSDGARPSARPGGADGPPLTRPSPRPARPLFDLTPWKACHDHQHDRPSP